MLVVVGAAVGVGGLAVAGLARWNGLSVRELEMQTRPVDADKRARLAERYAGLPNAIKTPNQVLGRMWLGCEGTHGVFPRCNFACSPCYHGKEANQIRTDGPHTIGVIDEQMGFARTLRGTGIHAQLIGGEVSLLGPEYHAQALLVMERHGRIPMSFTNGDFGYEYLEALALGPDGKPRFSHLAFAGHFDSWMFGRRGIKRPKREADLHPFRERFCNLFKELRAKHGVSHHLAHNMTVTPANVDEIPEVVRACHGQGWRMMSFQPAARVGDPTRWKTDFRLLDSDYIWGKIEEGAGARLPFRTFQTGDERCNRTVWMLYVNDQCHHLLDAERSAWDARCRDAWIACMGGLDYTTARGGSRAIVALRILRAVLAAPFVRVDALPLILHWAARFLLRVGPLNLATAMATGRIYAMTFVMHSFMHADDVQPAWKALEEGRSSHPDRRIQDTMDRLCACSYVMVHPETGRAVPACVQHSVLDPAENERLKKILPIHGVEKADLEW